MGPTLARAAKRIYIHRNMRCVYALSCISEGDSFIGYDVVEDVGDGNCFIRAASCNFPEAAA